MSDAYEDILFEVDPRAGRPSPCGGAGSTRRSAPHRVIREVPKPVITAVNGYATGGGQVLHVLCDPSIGADLDLILHTGEAAEGINALTAKRPPDFVQFP